MSKDGAALLLPGAEQGVCFCWAAAHLWRTATCVFFERATRNRAGTNPCTALEAPRLCHQAEGQSRGLASPVGPAMQLSGCGGQSVPLIVNPDAPRRDSKQSCMHVAWCEALRSSARKELGEVLAAAFFAVV